MREPTAPRYAESPATIERERQWALARTVWLVSFVPGLLIGIVIGAWGL